QYTAMWKTAQRLTKKPVKFGTILPELLAASVADDHYKDPIERTYAFSEALNAELNELADAGCPVIQMEEPQIHMVPARGKAIGEVIKDKKVVIGVVDHHTLQIERPDEVAALIREALKHIPPERLVISSDCGMGREGMSRRHATYKMVAMVLGTNIVRKELG